MIEVVSGKKIHMGSLLRRRDSVGSLTQGVALTEPTSGRESKVYVFWNELAGIDTENPRWESIESLEVSEKPRCADRGSDEILIMSGTPKVVAATYDYDDATTLAADRIPKTYADGGYKLPILEGVYSVGTNPVDAIRALGLRIGWGELTDFAQQDVEPHPTYDGWFYTFLADSTSMKAAGRAVPGGVILTWWK